jgi:dTDP-4-dehydrorhamnose reductase
MDLLVLGAGGLVGSNVVSEALGRDWTVTGTYHTDPPAFDVPLDRLDLRDDERVRQQVRRTDPEAVINCAAMTDVDGCERAPERARAVNADAPGTVADVCRERDVRFVHLSTDYVFAGETTTPYDESGEASPIQEYGRTKLAGERAVQRRHDASLIVRLSFVYGVHRAGPSPELAGFPEWVRGRLRTEEPVPLFTDQRITPSRAGQAAGTVLDLLREGSTGTYNVACRSCVTPYEFGVVIRDRLAAPTGLLEEASMADVDRAARRPRYTCLDVGAVESRLGREQPALADDLDAVGSYL